VKPIHSFTSITASTTSQFNSSSHPKKLIIIAAPPFLQISDFTALMNEHKSLCPEPAIDHKKPKPPVADSPNLTSQNADSLNHPMKLQNSMTDAEHAADRANGSKKRSRAFPHGFHQISQPDKMRLEGHLLDY
jgi:hypothetical protein